MEGEPSGPYGVWYQRWAVSTKRRKSKSKSKSTSASSSSSVKRASQWRARVTACDVAREQDGFLRGRADPAFRSRRGCARPTAMRERGWWMRAFATWRRRQRERIHARRARGGNASIVGRPLRRVPRAFLAGRELHTLAISSAKFAGELVRCFDCGDVTSPAPCTARVARPGGGISSDRYYYPEVRLLEFDTGAKLEDVKLTRSCFRAVVRAKTKPGADGGSREAELVYYARI